MDSDLQVVREACDRAALTMPHARAAGERLIETVRQAEHWKQKSFDWHARAETVESKLQEAERERDEARENGEGFRSSMYALEERVATLREALGAYRSALRSGERESARMIEMGDAALSAADPGASK